MTELEEVFQDFKEIYGLDSCVICSRPRHMKDAMGFPWCAEHEHHGQVVTWGKRHGYPEINFRPYAIGSGEHGWWIAAVAGNEDFLWTALAYIEYLDSLEVAS